MRRICPRQTDAGAAGQGRGLEPAAATSWEKGVLLARWRLWEGGQVAASVANPEDLHGFGRNPIDDHRAAFERMQAKIGA